MCGICGMIGRAEQRERVLERMMKAIEHRGPDDSKSYISEEAALGFQRLSIIDLDRGVQPMHNEDGKKVLVFNGEIYNYRKLRKELIQKGHIFENDSDSEVLLHGYEEFGEKMLQRLRGMFAFAIWDEEKKELFAARDFFGIKPFYYTVVDGVLVFASEIKSILEYPGYQRALNEDALEQYLSFQYPVLEETFFKGIYQLMPGHYLTYRDQKLEIVQYFEPSLAPDSSKKEERCQKDVQKILERSIKRHLVSDVEVGSFLSGGVDSSLLTAVSGCDQAFTVGFLREGALYDETEDAKQLAAFLKRKHHCKYIEKDEYEKAIPKVMYYMDEPFGDASAVALYFLAGEASKQVKVVLSGEGSDEFFGGYNIYREPETLKFVTWLPLGLRKKTAKLAEKLPRHMKGRGYLMRAAIPLNERYIGNAYIFHEKEKKQLLKRGIKKQPKELLKETYRESKNLKDAEQMQTVDLRYWLPGDILRKADRMSMAHSLEVRVPFVDYDVYEVAKKLPYNMKLGRHATKYILRQSALSYIPKKSSDKRKLGFPIPIRNWIKEDDWYQKIKEAFTSETAKRYFHTKYLLHLLEEHRAGVDDHSRKIWTVYVFLIWHRIYFEEEYSPLSAD